jgi:hypothetical protein
MHQVEGKPIFGHVISKSGTANVIVLIFIKSIKYFVHDEDAPVRPGATGLCT